MNEQELRNLLSKYPEGSVAHQYILRMIQSLRMAEQERHNPLEDLPRNHRAWVNRAMREYQTRVNEAEYYYGKELAKGVEERERRRLYQQIALVPGGQAIVNYMERQRSPGWSGKERNFLLKNGVNPASFPHTRENEAAVRALIAQEERATHRAQVERARAERAGTTMTFRPADPNDFQLPTDGSWGLPEPVYGTEDEEEIRKQRSPFLHGALFGTLSLLGY